MNGAERWNRLAVTIAAADLPVTTVSSRPNGTTHFISGTLPSGDRVEIHDKWWRKNPQVWIGYQVHVEDADGIERRSWPITKKRSEVIAAVREALMVVTA